MSDGGAPPKCGVGGIRVDEQETGTWENESGSPLRDRRNQMWAVRMGGRGHVVFAPALLVLVQELPLQGLQRQDALLLRASWRVFLGKLLLLLALVRDLVLTGPTLFPGTREQGAGESQRGKEQGSAKKSRGGKEHVGVSFPRGGESGGSVGPGASPRAGLVERRGVPKGLWESERDGELKGGEGT